MNQHGIDRLTSELDGMIGIESYRVTSKNDRWGRTDAEAIVQMISSNGEQRGVSHTRLYDSTYDEVLDSIRSWAVQSYMMAAMEL